MKTKYRTDWNGRENIVVVDTDDEELIELLKAGRRQIDRELPPIGTTRMAAFGMYAMNPNVLERAVGSTDRGNTFNLRG